MQISDFLDSLGSPFSFFYTTAHAQSLSFIPPEVMQFAPILFVLVLMYFLVLRPQTKKAKQHRDMIEALRRGDRVLTAGGLIGTITKVDNGAEVQIELAEGVRVRVVKATLAQVLAKTEPYKESDNFIEETSAISTSMMDDMNTKTDMSVISRKKPSSKVSSLPRKTTKPKDNL